MYATCFGLYLDHTQDSVRDYKGRYSNTEDVRFSVKIFSRVAPAEGGG